MKIPSLLLLLSIMFTHSPLQAVTVPVGDVNYISKTGTVNSVKQNVTTFRSTTDWVTIKLAKTGGKAHTIVQVYANNLLQKTLEFKSGNRLPYKDCSITNARNKNIKVVIINKSVTNLFKFRLNCTGMNTCRQNEISGTLPGGESRTYPYVPQCSGVTVRVTRTGGRAAGRASIFKQGQLVETLEFPRGPVPDAKWVRLEGVEGSMIRVIIRNLADPSKELRYDCVINEFRAP